MYNAIIRFSDLLVAQINIDLETFDVGAVAGHVAITSPDGTVIPFDLVISIPDAPDNPDDPDGPID